jgi:hypothetical protein
MAHQGARFIPYQTPNLLELLFGGDSVIPICRAAIRITSAGTVMILIPRFSITTREIPLA